MIDARNNNYLETLLQTEELTDLLTKFEANVSQQLPQGISNEVTSITKQLIDWIEEVEFVLVEDYKV